MTKRDLRILASNEAEVARSRLVRAQQASEKGQRKDAMAFAAESAFDTGIATAYSVLCKEKGFQAETVEILDQCHGFIGGKKQSVKVPQNAKSALKLAGDGTGAIPSVFYAGMGFGYAQAKKNDKVSRQAIEQFHVLASDLKLTTPMQSNPMSSNLKRKLLK